MSKRCKNLALLFVVIFNFSGFSQLPQFGFMRSDSIAVFNQSGEAITDPWVGGLNNCQFFEMDLNLDQVNDLVVFDKHGNKTIPFIKHNDCGNTGYEFAPQYRDLLPAMTSWVISYDYNLDEKMDLFTYTLGGIKVYENTSVDSFELRLVKSRLTSDYGSGAPINLFVSEADFPGIADINGDEAVDVANFWALGKYIEYHQNIGIQNLASYDSLSFSLKSSCWGKFEENESSNILTLNSDCQSKGFDHPEQRHSGSTLLLLDLNGDAKKDILIGDVDYPHLISLTNGGTNDSAYMIVQDTLFPSAEKPVRLYAMPAAASIDVDFDKVPDLLVSPFDPSRDKSENQNSIWLYKNIGTRSVPQYQFVKPNFLQDQMIDLGSGAYPTFADVDGNGLLDLVVGNWGAYDSSKYIGSFLHSSYSSSVSLYLNTGTPSKPIFQLKSTDIGQLRGLNRRGFFPTFGDLDGDGDQDLIVGDETGKLIYLENSAAADSTPVFSLPILNFQNITVNSYSAPQLYDLNKDGKLDLIIGDSLGKLHYYQNNGTVNAPLFNRITDTLGGVNVRNASVSYYGYSTPCFFSQNDTTYLAVGSEGGTVFTYGNIDHNLSGKFTLINDSTFFIRNNQPIPIYEGNRSGVAIADLNHDSYPDLMLGNFSGGLTYYQGTAHPSEYVRIQEAQISEMSRLKSYPNPTSSTVTFKFENSDETCVQIRIYNTLMQLVYSSENQSIHVIDFSTLEKGIYSVQLISSKNKRYQRKIVKI